jgi:hypothetical protein
MELIFVFLLVVALLGLLDWAALRWGYNSRRMHISDSFTERRADL